jgi:hypothetical protein
VRLEAIDALETHFEETHQELAGANAARDALLVELGFTNVVFFNDLPNKVQSADQDSIRGHVLSNGIDANGRLIAFIYPGDHPGPDGAAVFVDPALVDRSVNARLLAASLVYPAFYATLPADLRTHLAGVSQAARDARRRPGCGRARPPTPTARPPSLTWPAWSSWSSGPSCFAASSPIWPRASQTLTASTPGCGPIRSIVMTSCSCSTSWSGATCTMSSVASAIRSS